MIEFEKLCIAALHLKLKEKNFMRSFRIDPIKIKFCLNSWRTSKN